MHDTALKIGQKFFEAYADGNSSILELGSCNVNGSLRDVAPQGAMYIGLDTSAGPSVDVVIEPHKALPISSNSVDIVVSSSMFEHDLFFWETFLEMVRVAKPGGIVYINAPSNGGYHCYPVDNWRFYPDCGKALEAWAQKSGHALTLIESFVAERESDVWNDFAAIFKKDHLTSPDGLTFLSVPSTNAWRFGRPKVDREREASEDMAIIATCREKIATLERTLVDRI